MKQPTGNMWQEAAVRLGSTDRGKKQKVINAFKEQTTSVRDELSLFLTETSFTPIVLIYNSTSALKKLAWSVLVLGFLAYSIVQCYWLLERYYSYPVEVKLDLKASVELEFPSVTICNLNPIRQSSARHEPYKALEKFVQPESDDILFKATLKSWVFEETCTESDFQCSNGRCVSKGFVCDGIDDCNNNDDEANCADYICPAGKKKCSADRCLALESFCDGQNDCPDSQDEENCTGVACPENYFRCNTSRCIPSTWLCDSLTDCLHGEDEKDCPVSSNSTSSIGTTMQVTSSDQSTHQTTAPPKSGRRKREAKIVSGLPKKQMQLPEKLRQKLLTMISRDGHKEKVINELYRSYREFQKTGSRQQAGPTQVTRRKRQAAQRMSGTDKSSIAVDWSKLLSNSTFTKWDMLNSSGAGSFYQTKDDEYEAAMTYAYITAILNSSTVEPAGHQKKDFIASCKFGGYYCSPMNFTYFHNHKYGNCYTFNSRHVEDTLTTRFPGPTYGLILELFINQQEYIANLASEAGARIIIHKKGTIPFPEDEGISVIPGRSSSIGIKQVSYSRLPPPHGVCGYEAKTTDYYVHYLGTSHSKLSCLKSCYQDIIMEYCACAVTFFYIIPNVTICNMTDPITENCVNSLPSIASERYKLCDEKCPQPCEETHYELSISQAGWPSTKYQDFLREKLGQTNALYIQAANTQDEFTKVQIYYQDLIYQHVEQQKAYESMNLISDLGGQLGLWLGLSAITIGEFCSFLFSIGRSLPSKCCSAKTSPGPGTSVTSIQPVILEDLYDDLKSDACRYIQSDAAFPQSSEYFP